MHLIRGFCDCRRKILKMNVELTRSKMKWNLIQNYDHYDFQNSEHHYLNIPPAIQLKIFLIILYIKTVIGGVLTISKTDSGILIESSEQFTENLERHTKSTSYPRFKCRFRTFSYTFFFVHFEQKFQIVREIWTSILMKNYNCNSYIL